MADFLLAAWFLWMTPLVTALSSLVEATLSASAAAEASPESAAVLNLRTKVRSSLLTALLRSVRRALVLMRLSWDLMFATRTLSHIRVRSMVLCHEGDRSDSGPGVGIPVVEPLWLVLHTHPTGARTRRSNLAARRALDQTVGRRQWTQAWNGVSAGCALHRWSGSRARRHRRCLLYTSPSP